MLNCILLVYISFCMYMTYFYTKYEMNVLRIDQTGKIYYINGLCNF